MCCDKLPYNNPRIDVCMREFIDWLNMHHDIKTLLCCCGHDRYPETIVILNKELNLVYEYYTGITLSHGVRPRKRYYKRDPAGYYYIPEISAVKP